MPSRPRSRSRSRSRTPNISNANKALIRSLIKNHHTAQSVSTEIQQSENSLYNMLKKYKTNLNTLKSIEGKMLHLEAKLDRNLRNGNV